jgi:CheY-like chemotaxis protein
MEPSCKIVLVVDDHDDARQTLADYLGAVSEFHVASAANGAEAITVARRLKPAVVVMDLVMPVMGGVDAIRVLKADPDTRGIHVIVVTAFRATDDAVQRAILAGAAEILTKPVDPTHLVRRIRYYCDSPI